MSTGQPAHVATPNICGNGCHTGHGPDRIPTVTEGDARLCANCVDRLDTWLRQIPETYALLPYVVEHGTVGINPEQAHTKRPDPAAPLRLEVLDLLDSRRGWQHDESGRPMLQTDNRRGVFGIVLEFAARVRAERRIDRLCDCGHIRQVHRWRMPRAALYADGQLIGPVEPYCHTARCTCTRWRVTTTLSRECGFLIQNLPWITEQEWVVDLYEKVKPLVREMLNRVGDYGQRPVGMCVALVSRPGLNLQVLCGGPVYLDGDRNGVHCAACGDRHSADRLGRLGRDAGLIADWEAAG